MVSCQILTISDFQCYHMDVFSKSGNDKNFEYQQCGLINSNVGLWVDSCGLINSLSIILQKDLYKSSTVNIYVYDCHINHIYIYIYICVCVATYE